MVSGHEWLIILLKKDIRNRNYIKQNYIKQKKCKILHGKLTDDDRHSPEKYSILNFLIERLALWIDRQEMFQIGIVSQIRVDPIAKSELFLQPNGMGRTLARSLRDSTQSLEILLLRHDMLESGTEFVSLELLAEFLELVERQSTLVLQPLLVVIFLDHLSHLVSWHFEAANVQRVSQFRKVDETVTIFVDLSNANKSSSLIG